MRLRRRQEEVIAGDGWECRNGEHRVETGRLILRPFAAGDEEGLFRVISDPEVVYWQGYPTEPEDQREFARDWFEKITTVGRLDLHLAVCDRWTGEMIGLRSVAPAKFQEQPGEPLVSCATGSSIMAGWRERGLGKEELRATLRLITEHLGYVNVFATSEVVNHRAIRQYESAGFKRATTTADHTLPNGREVVVVHMLRTAPARRTCPVEALKA
jgi:RimJ/RimL family protein N-acetyltransferase